MKSNVSHWLCNHIFSWPVIPRDQNNLHRKMWLPWILVYTNVTMRTHSSCDVPILRWYKSETDHLTLCCCYFSISWANFMKRLTNVMSKAGAKTYCASYRCHDNDIFKSTEMLPWQQNFKYIFHYSYIHCFVTIVTWKQFIILSESLCMVASNLIEIA